MRRTRVPKLTKALETEVRKHAERGWRVPHVGPMPVGHNMNCGDGRRCEVEVVLALLGEIDRLREEAGGDGA